MSCSHTVIAAAIALSAACAEGPEHELPTPDPDDQSLPPEVVSTHRDGAVVERSGPPRIDAGGGLLDAALAHGEAGIDGEPQAQTVGPFGCVPGTYGGSFEGEIYALFGALRIGIQGAIRFELPDEGAAESVEIRDGVIDGADAEGHPVRSVVSGTLDCTTMRLKNGRITSGTYTRPDPIFGHTTTATFTGATSAVFTGDPPVGQGSWSVVNERNARTGSGTWSAQLEAPAGS